MTSAEEQKTINALQANWVWVPDWIDASKDNTVGRLVTFTRTLNLTQQPSQATIHISADTRYKLLVNGARVTVGPSRGSSSIWYYDTVDLAPFLRAGENEVRVIVLRCFAPLRGAMPFVRTAMPGLTISGHVDCADGSLVDLSSTKQWEAWVDESVQFPRGLVDDVFLHIYERATPCVRGPTVTPIEYGIRTVNGELSPWRLRPREIPLPEQSPVAISNLRNCQSDVSSEDWMAFYQKGKPVSLAANSSHTMELQAEVHSTAFLRWTINASPGARVLLKMTYSEGYELEPRSYPFFRSKADRLDASQGTLIGPFDEVTLEVGSSGELVYEPLWFRTFRLIRVELTVATTEPVSLSSFTATQTNYPMDVKASWSQPEDPQSTQIWDVSIRTMRNCMFDGYSDCPFYEQLQYSGDSRSVGLFHYLLSGDDRLMRQAITNFAASVTAEGLTQSRFPSHIPQIIAGFSLYWILQVCDHHLYFGDDKYTRLFLPRVDGVLEFYNAHVDELGLVSGFPEDVWQFVDWVTTWAATDEHPDKGVPTSGRRTNRHTYFSLLYAHVLKQTARLVRDVGRAGHATEYENRATALLHAVNRHCHDGRFYTDSTADVADDLSYSQHCQVFAVLAGAVATEEGGRLLQKTFASPGFSKCSYMMMFYAFRAFSLAGDEVYEAYWPKAWDPWRGMLANNLTTWEEDDVRQRSDCHAWGSVPIYEFCTELAGVQPMAPGSTKVLFKPRLGLTKSLSAKVALGGGNLATVAWTTSSDGIVMVDLKMEKAREVVSVLPGGGEENHGVQDEIKLEYKLIAQSGQ